MIVVIEIKDAAQEVLDKLSLKAIKSRKERILVNGIYKRFDILKIKPEYGDQISQKLIPAEYSIKYQVKNLFRIELPGFWRMFYTLNGNNAGKAVIIRILDIVDHDTYNKKFGYKGH